MSYLKKKKKIQIVLTHNHFLYLQSLSHKSYFLQVRNTSHSVICKNSRGLPVCGKVDVQIYVDNIIIYVHGNGNGATSG